MKGFWSAPKQQELSEELVERIRAAAGNPESALSLAPTVCQEVGLQIPGNASRLWRGLAELGRLDLTVARSLEPHLDALSILEQARGLDPALRFPENATWGVYAAEGPGSRLRATQDSQGNWTLSGRKPWCSLAGIVSHALVTAWSSERERTLFAVALDDPGITVNDDVWMPRGLETVRTGSLEFAEAAARPVGPEGWYFSRPGFSLGSIGVAAIWLGAAMALAGRLRETCSEREPDQLALLYVGDCENAIFTARAVLDRMSDFVDEDVQEIEWAEALRVRCIVHDVCERVLAAVAHGLGPAPLTQDEPHARRVADLQVYLRQHKAERDTAAVGAAILQGMSPSWSRS